MKTSLFCLISLLFLGCAADTETQSGAPNSEAVGVTADAITESATAALTFTSTWDTGYCAEVSVRNNGAFTTNSWTVRVNMLASTFNARWNGNFAQSGTTLTITPSGNAAVASGAIANPKPGFCAQKPSGGALPSGLSASAEYCGNLYRDADGDGYGNASSPLFSCGNPVGYVKNNRDRCDSDAQAHPGVTAYFATANACGTFDYDGDGVVSKKSNGPTGCIETGMNCVLNAARTACNAVPIGTLPAACNGKFTSYYTGDCGNRWTFAGKGCSFVAEGPTCVMWTSDGIGIAQECR
jgi:hypothetical protein